jgi:hypothetical protein
MIAKFHARLADARHRTPEEAPFAHVHYNLVRPDKFVPDILAKMSFSSYYRKRKGLSHSTNHHTWRTHPISSPGRKSVTVVDCGTTASSPVCLSPVRQCAKSRRTHPGTQCASTRQRTPNAPLASRLREKRKDASTIPTGRLHHSPSRTKSLKEKKFYLHLLSHGGS